LPERFGKSDLIAPLGKVGEVEAYLAVQRGPFSANKLVVIKAFMPVAGVDQSMRERLAKEARVSMRLSHPNIVNTFDFSVQGDDLFIITEFIKGPSLLQTLEKVGRDKMPLELHLWILSQVLAALEYAHGLRDFDGTALGLAHQSLTPSTLLLSYTGAVRLTDFGLSKILGDVAGKSPPVAKERLAYLSPEQCLGKPGTPESDIYTVGLMLWEAMARRTPSVGDTLLQVYQARIVGTERITEDIWPGAPPLLGKILRRALAPLPENRFPSASEFRRELETFLAGTPPAGFGPGALVKLLERHFQTERDALERTLAARVSRDLGAVPSGPSAGLPTSPNHSDEPPTLGPTALGELGAPKLRLKTLERPAIATFPEAPRVRSASLPVGTPIRRPPSSESPRPASALPPPLRRVPTPTQPPPRAVVQPELFGASEAQPLSAPSGKRVPAALGVALVVIGGVASVVLLLRRNDSPAPLVAPAVARPSEAIGRVRPPNLTPLPAAAPRPAEGVASGHETGPDTGRETQGRSGASPAPSNNPSALRRVVGGTPHAAPRGPVRAATKDLDDTSDHLPSPGPSLAPKPLLSRKSPAEITSQDNARPTPARPSGGVPSDELRPASPENGSRGEAAEKPGMDLHRASSPASGLRPLDEKDPYSR